MNELRSNQSHAEAGDAVRAHATRLGVTSLHNSSLRSHIKPLHIDVLKAEPTLEANEQQIF